MPQTNHDFQIMHLPLSKEGWSENMTVPHLNASISLAVQFIQLFCSYMNQSYILHLKFEKGLPFIYEPYLKRKLPLFLLSSKTNRHLVFIDNFVLIHLVCGWIINVSFFNVSNLSS